MFFKSRLFGLSVVILSLVACLLWLTHYINVTLQDSYTQKAYTFTYELKRKNIKEIIYSVQGTIQQALKNSYISHHKELSDPTIQRLLETRPMEEWCETLEHFFPKQGPVSFFLFSSSSSLCGDASLKEHTSTTTLDVEKDIFHIMPLNPQHTLILRYTKEAIYHEVKEAMGKILRSMDFDDPNRYVWVKEIINYEGGENYAFRRIHPTLPHTEGMMLSTLSKDVMGNLRFQTELDGLNKEGEVYFEYYFTKKTTNEIEHKLGFSKLFKPFNWAIGTGVYLDDIQMLIDQQNQSIKKELNTYNLFLVVFALVLAGLCILFLYKKEQSELDVKEKDLSLSYKKEKLKNYQQVLYSMLDLVEKRDTYTAGHTQRVATYAMLIAEAMKLPQEKIDLLYEASIMHDIGKIATPDAILLKPGRLSESEYQIIQNHLTVGYELLSTMKAFEKHAQIMRDHHERYDGKGYPRGLKGEEISLSSHILILADAFDAMTSQRIYRSKKDLDTALTEIVALKGIQFSPQVVDAAYPILKEHGIIPTEHNYLSGTLEEARVAFYYKDGLTGLYNYHYLDHYLQSLSSTPDAKHQCGYLINICNFGNYNETHGWIAGDKQLCTIAINLQIAFPEAIIFRIFGDDFLILHQAHLPIKESDLLAHLGLQDSSLGVRLMPLELGKINATNFIELSTYISQHH